MYRKPFRDNISEAMDEPEIGDFYFYSDDLGNFEGDEKHAE